MSITWSIFPKFLQPLSVTQLADTIRDVGLDTTNLVIRDGYWVGRETFYKDLPVFMKQMRKEGLDVRFATAGFTVDEIMKEPSLVQALADEGIRDFRISYFKIEQRDPKESLQAATDSLRGVVDICMKHNIRAVYQLHFNFLVASASAGHIMVKDLPPEYMSIELDPGNQSFEGHENFSYATRLLGPHFTAAAIKDTALRPGKIDAAGRQSYERYFAPGHEGTVDWFGFFRACRDCNFDGTFVVMSHHNDTDMHKHIAALRDEIRYWRKVMKIVEEEKAVVNAK